eukprot:360748-Chlamydomonas_euryale.AAC.2
MRLEAPGCIPKLESSNDAAPKAAEARLKVTLRRFRGSGLWQVTPGLGSSRKLRQGFVPGLGSSRKLHQGFVPGLGDATSLDSISPNPGSRPGSPYIPSRDEEGGGSNKQTAAVRLLLCRVGSTRMFLDTYEYPKTRMEFVSKNSYGYVK